MASIYQERTGHRTIQFVGTDGKRRSIRLGKVPQKAAESIKIRVEHILAAKFAGHALDDETARWLSTLSATLMDKLAAAGLVPKRVSQAQATLVAYLQDYVSRRIDVKPATKEVWGQVTRNLREHFGDDRELATISEADADDFKMYLTSEGLAPTTVHKRLQFARMFFRGAMKRRLIPSNPFADVTAKAAVRQDRQRFVTVEETERLLELCDPTWRVIVALARYGGLRCPSEVLSLRWENVDWVLGRIVVQSPKTEHHPGKSHRTIPLFPELRTVLEDAQELAAVGAVYVVAGNHRASAKGKSGWRNSNLRTHFKRLVIRAGLKPWPRLFQNLRASRETELARSFPIHVVTAWLGNTPRIALKHYLQITDADFERASNGGAESGARAVQKAVQQPAAESRKELPETTQAPASAGACADSCDYPLELAGTSNGEDRIRTCGTV
ncbi:MAG TPA: tyrosine-type recombinase/integrase [Pirellulales bacterium]|nr:tyrosine-type recombinase/integrase [Pirellulales bacterium]